MAGGVGVRGGGDMCEDRIQQIRDDLKSWIAHGGAEGLSLLQDMATYQYADLMLHQLNSARVKCVGAGDVGYPVAIGNTPKVCKFSIDSTGSQIVCDYVKFLATGDSDQYVLIHHEYAGLAGIEVPDQDDSHYDVSNQISGYLEEQVVKKLAVKSVSSEPKVGSRIVVEEDGDWPKAALITAITTDKNTYYRIRAFGEYGELGAEQTIEKVSIKGIEVSELHGVIQGQKAECDNFYLPAVEDNRFEGKVAHIYSNGFVEVETSPNLRISNSKYTSQSSWKLVYWSAIAGAHGTPHFGYPCLFNVASF
jgi:hypothetical protein